MSKLTVAAALLIALFALAKATTYTTTITTIRTNDIKTERHCPPEELQGQEGQELKKACSSYLSGQQGSQTENLKLRMKVDRLRQQQEEREQLQKCCRPLGRFTPDCRCDTIEEIVRQQSQQLGQGQQMQQMLEKARRLLIDCDLYHQDPCQIPNPLGSKYN